MLSIFSIFVVVIVVHLLQLQQHLTYGLNQLYHFQLDIQTGEKIHSQRITTVEATAAATEKKIHI